MPVFEFGVPKKGQKAKVEIHAQEREGAYQGPPVRMEDLPGEEGDGPKAEAKSE